jgi:hypothetical protein
MRGQVLACAEQHLETCQLAIGPHKRSCVPGEGRDNLARRKAAPRRRNRPNPTHGRVTAGSQVFRGDTHLQRSARGAPRGPRHAEERLPRRSQTNRRWSLGVTCSWPLPPWAAEQFVDRAPRIVWRHGAQGRRMPRDHATGHAIGPRHFGEFAEHRSASVEMLVDVHVECLPPEPAGG